MKILLLIPNSRKIYRSIPLGLLYICAALRQAGSHQIKIVDARVQNLGHKDISRQIKNFSPDIVGISSLNIEAPEVHKLASLVKQINAQCKVVIGGPYASSSPELIIQDSRTDFVVMGEGERTICNLINALENDGNLSGIEGLAFKNDGKTVINPPQTMIEDIDSIPFPAWDLIDMERYFNDIHRHSENPIPASNRIVSIFTSRGCPFGCIYCHNIFGKKIRLRSAQNVIQEIELLIKRYDVGEIEIVDDIFNFDLARAKQICDEIIKRGIKINLSFPNGLRIDEMDEELIIKLKQAGTHMVYYAIESASPKVQKEIRKNLNLEKAKQIIAQTVQQGIITGGTFMLGFPEETKEEILKTVRFAREAKFHIANFYYVTPYPNTELFKKLGINNVNLGRIGHYSFLKLSFNASSLSDSELKRIRTKAYREFYLRPSQMRRIWKVIPDKRMLFKNLCLVLKRSMIN